MSSLQQLIQEIKNATSEQMWSKQDIAKYMNVSEKTIGNRIIVLESFPNPISIPYGKGSKTNPRWYPQEVKKWIAQHRSKH